MTVGLIGIVLATYLRQEIVNTPCAETHWSLTPDEDKSKLYHGNIFIYVRDGCDCKSTLTKESIDLAAKISIEQLHNTEGDAGKVYHHHDDCWEAMVSTGVGTGEEPESIMKIKQALLNSDYKWTVNPDFDP